MLGVKLGLSNLHDDISVTGNLESDRTICQTMVTTHARESFCFDRILSGHTYCAHMKLNYSIITLKSLC